MYKFTLLQIGDLHYPDWKTEKAPVDLKSNTIAQSIIEDFSDSSLEQVLAGISGRVSKPDVDAIAFMGDFTSLGDAKKLAQAAHHMTHLCRPTLSGRLNRPQLLAVPGNHDVNREAALAEGPMLKFSNFCNVFASLGWSTPDLSAPVHFDLLGQSQQVVHAVLLNTSIGCWEATTVPAHVWKELNGERLNEPPIETEVHSQTPAEVAPAVPRNRAPAHHYQSRLIQYYQQLDCPYFSVEALDAVTQRAADVPESTPILIIGHHNIMPQRTPRISPFGEVLNAGTVRRALLSTNRTLIFLHGHIHQDPIEIISDPKYSKSKIISISAPLISNGWNEISFYFDENARGLGIRIDRQRIDLEGDNPTLRTLSPLFAPLHELRKGTLSNAALELYLSLRKKLKRGEKKTYYISQLANHDLPEDEAATLSLELFWSGVVHIDNLEHHTTDWRILVEG